MVMSAHIDLRILLVSAVASGQDKTVTAALARKLVRQGLRVLVLVFKIYPDPAAVAALFLRDDPT